LASYLLAAAPASGAATRALFLVGVGEKAAWQDMAYLAAVPAATRRTGKAPAVIAIDPSGKVGREVADYLARYRPQEVFALGLAAGAAAPAGLEWTVLEAGSAAKASRQLASRFWGTCERAVLCREDDYASGLLASSLAARLACPLLFCPSTGLDDKTQSAVKALGAKTLLAVGFQQKKAVAIADAVAAMGWLKASGVPCDYVAIVNPFDRTGTLQTKLSLVAPLLCAARAGLTVPMGFESHWMTPHETTPAEKRPAGLPEGEEPAHTGVADFDGVQMPFAIVSAPGGRGSKGGGTLKQIYLDRNCDGKFAGKGEGPFWSADTVDVAGASYSLVASGPTRRKKKAPVVLKTCTPTATEVRDRLRAVWKAAGRVTSNLCIIGHPDAVPFWLHLDGPEAETFVESDVPYANTDDDPFFEINVGRIIAESASFATLHASRVVTYGALLDPRWSHSVGFARWEDSLGPQFANVGFYNQYLHTKHDRPEVEDDKPLAPGAKRGRIKREGTFHAHSPLANVSAITHGAHSWYMGLGETYTVEANVLLSPCVVESAGCGPTALHVEKKFISVVSRLFRNGAVAFHGNAVPSPAPHQELRYGFWTSVLGGATLGEAHRDTLNRKMLTVLEGGQFERGGTDRRTLFARHLYGDPAFKMHLPDDRRVAPARTEVEGERVTVHGPERWYVAQIRVPEDWKRWADKPLYVLRAPGIYIRAQWCGEEYDREEVYADVAFTTRRTVKAIRQETKLPAPLGWRDKYTVDANADGTRTYRWRVRMADFDQIAGVIRAKADRIEYRIEY
jgi:hypothetical protein